MDYTYSIEDNTKQINSVNIFALHLLCYNINTDCKYPFLQFLMNKIPFCDNLVKEELTLPYIVLKNIECDIESVLKTYLHKYFADEMDYKGIIEYNSTHYALINIDTKIMKPHRNSLHWFVLPSEIIGPKSVCNIPIDVSVVRLFTLNPELSILTNTNNHTKYIIPDAAYTIGNIKSVEFNSVFGNQKSKAYVSCSNYYFFYRSFKDVLVIHKEEINAKDAIGINRYAVFVEGNIYLEETEECELTNKTIETEYNEPCIIICYLKEHILKPDLLVKETESSVCISYHTNIEEYENI